MISKKKGSISISSKRDALRLLGENPDGTIAMLFLNEATGKRHTPSKAAKRLGVARGFIYQWKAKFHAIMQVPTRKAKNIKAIRGTNFHLIESAL